jgi:transposase
MGEYSEAFVGIDVAKSRHAIAIAEAGREGEIRHLGEVGATLQSMRKMRHGGVA